MTTNSDWASETEQALLDGALRLAPGIGWSWRLVRSAGRELGLSEAEVELLLPQGPGDLAALYGARLDAKALAALAPLDPATLKIRERIRAGALAWLDAARTHEAASRRWSGFLALAPHTPLGLRLAWTSADVLWRWAGDVATDENHYTKRGLLAGILISTLAVALASGRGAAERFLDRRIDGVMAFERWKRSLAKPGDLATRISGALGALRHGRAPAPAEPWTDAPARPGFPTPP